MRKIFKILAILIILYIVIGAALFIFVLLSENGVFENYSGYKTVDVPTDTETKATIKLPEKWSFDVINGRVYIKDQNGNVIASEIYEDWYKVRNEDGEKYDNLTEISINESYVDFYNQYNYLDLIYANHGSCRVKKYISHNEEVAYILEIDVYFSEKGNYQLVMILENEYFENNENIFKKIVLSHRYPKNADKHSE